MHDRGRSGIIADDVGANAVESRRPDRGRLDGVSVDHCQVDGVDQVTGVDGRLAVVTVDGSRLAVKSGLVRTTRGLTPAW